MIICEIRCLNNQVLLPVNTEGAFIFNKSEPVQPKKSGTLLPLDSQYTGRCEEKIRITQNANQFVIFIKDQACSMAGFRTFTRFDFAVKFAIRQLLHEEVYQHE